MSTRILTLLIVAFSALLSACSASPPALYVPPEQRRLEQQEQPWRNDELLIIAYHDVEDHDPNQAYLSVSTEHLRQQFSWLQENNYVPVSVEQIMRARQGVEPLPEKAVLLSFDDGYQSFYTRVFPLLKAYHWPALLAPVGKWLDTPDNEKVDFGGLPTERSRFLHWAQIDEMANSGLVEIGAHTQNMHYGAIANPQGNIQPVAAAHRYLTDQKRYETDAEYTARFREDVRAISARVKQHAGKPPRVWVWPYGRISGLGLQILEQEGYQMALTLTDGVANVHDLMNMPRYLVDNDPDISTFAGFITAREDRQAERVVHVDLDYVYDPDPAQMERNLSALVQRIADLKPRSVYLQAFADPTGDGLVRSVYFPNRHLPMRADLFNRTAWQLSSRAHVNVFAWMPVLAIDTSEPAQHVLQWHADGSPPSLPTQGYRRLSPFDPRTRQIIGDLYEDLGRSAIFFGVVFHDDATLTDFEDASPAALDAYEKAGFGRDIGTIRANPEQFERWTRFKSQALIDLTQELADRVRKQRGPQISTARNMYALPVLQPQSEQWFAQNLNDFLQAYDWTAVMAMPRMEDIHDQHAVTWLNELVDKVASHPEGLRRTVFEVQSVDWPGQGQPSRPLDSHLVAGWLNALTARGARHVGYYPDDFVNNQPKMNVIRPEITIEWYPTKND
ncbi:MAG TPA: poly-beta-1,6-N-acetyl-D-glucosamine N-deacetylase PgaB [Alcaligenes faecalis]|nr:poly-beta-1,6-N-acetyl-D-glucosamine N-deacetylase PgaB [Alcaligenes faecalis]HBQ88052.1 poly-beta-1,6-N-acetyl-D-glucosamine N-deacetylase PgaB [Alcaligenes faecalis]